MVGVRRWLWSLLCAGALLAQPAPTHPTAVRNPQLELARHLLDAGRPDEAAALLAPLAVSQPKDPTVQLLLGEAELARSAALRGRAESELAAVSASDPRGASGRRARRLLASPSAGVPASPEAPAAQSPEDFPLGTDGVPVFGQRPSERLAARLWQVYRRLPSAGRYDWLWLFGLLALVLPGLVFWVVWLIAGLSDGGDLLDQGRDSLETLVILTTMAAIIVDLPLLLWFFHTPAGQTFLLHRQLAGHDPLVQSSGWLWVSGFVVLGCAIASGSLSDPSEVTVVDGVLFASVMGLFGHFFYWHWAPYQLVLLHLMLVSLAIHQLLTPVLTGWRHERRGAARCLGWTVLLVAAPLLLARGLPWLVVGTRQWFGWLGSKF